MMDCWQMSPDERPDFADLRQFFAGELDDLQEDFERTYSLISSDATDRGQ